MIGRPQDSEAAPYYFNYINLVAGHNISAVIERQSAESQTFLQGISEQASLHRYAPDKWSIRQVLNHLTDTERVFTFRAFWFARGFDAPLPSFDQNVAVTCAAADSVSWAALIEEFRQVRLSTISLFRNLPPEAWTRTGTASGNPFTVRALAYLVAGHVEHHLTILRDRYL
jgi:DinB superfamily